MPRGFIYIVDTVNRTYEQRDFTCVPTVWEGRIYFGACKVPMRPRVNKGDWIFGVSNSETRPRRIVYAAQVEDRITFADAYLRYPDLRGPRGPNPVQPLDKEDPLRPWPYSKYAPVKGSPHEERWHLDLARPDLDRFFVCRPPDGFRNRWLGRAGPVVDSEILDFFNGCMVFGSGLDGTRRNTGRLTAPVALGGRCIGLHLETPRPEELLALCEVHVEGTFPPGAGPQRGRTTRRRGCGDAAPTVKPRASSRC